MSELAVTVLRLRPVVHASPLPNGIHVRGARSSFTMNGGAGLWRLWKALAIALVDGRSQERLTEMAAGQPAAQAAMATLLQQLRDHDMLVEVPREWGELMADGPPTRIARWLESVAEDPRAAFTRIQAATVTVRGTGPVAAGAIRALEAAGVRVARSDEPGGPGCVVLDAGETAVAPETAGYVVLDAGQIAVAAETVGEVGFVTPTGPAASVRREAEALAERLGSAGAGVTPSRVLAALVGGASAHRLVCALAGLPDPSTDPLAFAPTAGTATPEHPTVLVARLDPLRAAYHPWLGSATPPRPVGGTSSAPDAGRRSLDEVLVQMEALCDAETGVLPPSDVDELPQVPAGLARCRIGDLLVCGVGGTTAMARLVAAVGAAEQAIGLAGRGEVVVGADRVHAEGSLLRRAVHRSVADLGGEVAEDSEWAADARARSWWKAVTLRFGAYAELRVRRLADGVYHAELHRRAEPPNGGGLTGWAVEGTAGDAAAVCALSAAGALQWLSAGGDAGAGIYGPNGALPGPADPGSAAEPWETGAWTWPVHPSARERVFQERLRRVLGQYAPIATAVAPDNRLLRALAEAGFVTLAAAP